MGRLPPWVWLYKHKEEQLRTLLSQLRHQGPRPVFKDTCHDIEIHPMNFFTGETDPSMFEFFAPDCYTQVDIASTRLDPNSPFDDEFSKMRRLKRKTKNFDASKMHHQLYRTFANYIKKSPIGNKAPSSWKLADMEDNGSLFNSNDIHGFTIEKGAMSSDPSSGAQLVVMKSDTLKDKISPSVGELLVLVKWMQAAFQPQMRHLSKTSRLRHGERFKLDFPTMVISFLPKARVRILYGYFDQDRLKVAYTQALNFDADDYAAKMDILLQWAWPEAIADNSKPIPLPTILDDEEDEWNEWDSLTGGSESDGDSESAWETEEELEGSDDSERESEEELDESNESEWETEEEP